MEAIEQYFPGHGTVYYAVQGGSDFILIALNPGID